MPTHEFRADSTAFGHRRQVLSLHGSYIYVQDIPQPLYIYIPDIIPTWIFLVSGLLEKLRIKRHFPLLCM